MSVWLLLVLTALLQISDDARVVVGISGFGHEGHAFI